MEWLLFLIYPWPVLLPTGLALGLVVLWVSTDRGLLIWSLLVMFLAGIGFVFFLGEGAQRYMFFVKLCLGLSVAPAVGISVFLGRSVMRRSASTRSVLTATIIACLLSSPIVAAVALVLGCVLTGECL